MNPAFESLGSLPGAVFATTLALAGAYALGAPLVPHRQPNQLHFESTILRIATGLILLAWLAATLGMLRWLSGSLPAGLLVAAAIPGLIVIGLSIRHYLAKRRLLAKKIVPSSPTPKPRIVQANRGAKRSARPPRQLVTQPRWSPQWLAVPATLIALVTLGPALAYPTGWDELVYHNELPKRWLTDGWPALYADLPYSGFPSAAELLFWLMAPIEGTIAPRLLMACCWLLGLAATYLLLRTRLAPYPAAALTTAFSLSGTLLLISANCYVESLLLLITASLVLCLTRRATHSSLILHPSSFAVGTLAGGAAAIKLTGLIVTLLPLAFYILQFLTGRLRPKAAALATATYLLVAAIIAFPFYLRPYLLTGNPFYPYYAHWFTSDPATLEMSRFHHAIGAAFGVHIPSAFFTSPILLASDLNTGVNYDGSFGWQLLIILFLAVLALLELRRPKRRLHILWPALLAAACYTFWFFTAQQARFAIPAMLGVTLLAATGLHSLHRRARSLALGLLLVATVISLPIRTAGHYVGSWLSALHIISHADYVSISTGGNDPSDRFYIELLKALQEHTPPDAKLLVLFEHRGFYFPRRYEIGTPLFQAANFTPPEDFGDPEKIQRLLEERRITHLVMTNAPAGPDQVPASFDRLEHFLPCFEKLRASGRLTPLWSSQRYLLLEFRPHP